MISKIGLIQISKMIIKQMTLEEKGQIVPPPILSKHPQMVSIEIQKWKDIIAATHWHIYDNKKVDGADFYLDKQELGHIHLDGSVHLATGSALGKILIDKQLAQKFPYGAAWVVFKIETEQDIEKALFLFQLNYERLSGTPLNTLILKLDSRFISKI
jgi:Family of unknown function (DUF5519)